MRKHLFKWMLLLVAIAVPWVTQAQVSLPYTMDFEDETEFGNWTAQSLSGYSSNANEMGRMTTAKINGDYGFRFSSYNDRGQEAQYLISPLLSAPKGVVVTLNYKSSSGSSEKFRVGYSTTDAEVSSFTWSSEYTGTSTLQSLEETFPSGTQYVAIYYYANYQYRLYVDDIALTAPPSCIKPTDLAVTPSVNTAVFSWTASETAVTYDWLYTLAGNDPDWDNAESAEGTSVAINGLSPMTSYVAYVRANCGGEDVSDVMSIPFTTACATIMVDADNPYTCNFENGNLPQCWEVLNGTVSVKNNSSNSHESSYYLDFRGAVGNAIALPEFADGGTTGLVLKFWTRPENYSNSSCGNLSVGYMADLTDATTYVELANWAYNTFSAYDQKEVPLATVPEGARVVMKQINNGSYYYWYVDDVEVVAAPSCQKPFGVTASSITSRSAVIDWTPGNEADDTWLVEHSTDGENWEGIDVSSSQKPYDLEGLEPNTEYQVRVKTLCDGGLTPSEASTTITFRTNCEALEVTEENPYVEGFENEVSCWDLGLATRYENSSWTTYSYSGSYCLRMYGTSVLAVMPDFIDVDLLQLDFYTKPYSTSTSYACTLEIGYMTEPTDASTFVAIKTLNSTESTSAYAPVHVALSAVPGSARIALRQAGSNSYSGWYIDSLVVSQMPKCAAPDNIVISNVTANSAAVAWTPAFATDDSWELQYSADGENWTASDALSASSYEFRGLTANTAYQVRVRTLCAGDEQSDWSSVSTFRTLCDVYTVTIEEPFTCDFENGIDCWQVLNGAVAPTSGSSNSHGGNYYLKFTGAVGNAIALPMLADGTSNGLVLKFWTRPENYSNNSCGNLSVGYMADITDATTYVELANWAYNTFSAYDRKEVSLADMPEGARIVMKQINNATNYWWYVDDVEVAAIPNCLPPAGIEVTDVYADHAVLTWAADENVNGWQLKLGDEVLDVLAEDVEMVEGNVVYTLEELESATDYTVQLRNLCGNDFSPWTEAANFTTLNDETAVVAINIEGMVSADIDVENHTVTVTMLYGSDFTAMNGSFTLSEGATAWYGEQQIPTTFTNVDLSNPMAVTVKAEDPTFVEYWTINVVNESCATATGLTVAPERVKATLTWNIGDVTVENFNLVVSAEAIENFEEVEAQTINVPGEETSRNYLLTGLDRGTEYHVYLKDVCSDWSVAQHVVFTTFDLSTCLTVAEGTTTNDVVPVNGYYCDSYQRSQTIYPAEMLASLQGKTVKSLHYYVSSGSSAGSQNWEGVDFNVRMMVVEASSFATTAFADVTDATLVYTGHLTANTADGMTVTLDRPFTYEGGNLLIEFGLETKTGYNRCYFYGSSVTGASVSAYNSSSYSNMTSVSARGFMPMVDFCYEDEACPAVAEFNVESVGTTEATLTWTPAEGDYLTQYNIIVSTEEIENFENVSSNIVAAGENTFTAISLNPFTTYYAYLQALCDDGSSTWVPATFRTQSACHTAENLDAVLTERNAVHVTWTNDENSAVQYVLATEELDADTLAAATVVDLEATDELDLDNLEYEEDYILYVRHNCGESVSPWQSVSFRTLSDCPSVENIETTVYFNAVTVDWTNGQYSPATAWRVMVTTLDENDEPVDIFNDVVSSHPYTVFGLTGETQYELAIAPVCGESEGEETGTQFTTPATPGDCAQVGEATTYSSNYGPVSGYYGYERNAYIFTPADGLSEGTIDKLSWNYYSGSANSIPAKIYLKNTTESAFSTTSELVWNEMIADATLVLDETVTISAGENEFDITDFEYTGGNLMLLVASNYGGSGGAATTAYYTASGSNNHAIVKKDNSIDDDASFSSNGSYSAQINNQRSNVKFCFVPSDCHAVRSLTVADVTTNSAEISWMPGGSETEWQMVVANTELDAEALAAAEPEVLTYINKSLTGLAVDADYNVYVRPVCDSENELYGDWMTVSFATVPTCPAPVAAEATVGEQGVVAFVVTAAENSEPASYEYAYWSVDDVENVITGTAETSEWTLTMTANGDYGWRVRANCGDENGSSRWINGNVFAVEDLVTDVTLTENVCDSYELRNSDNDVVATYTESGVYEETYEDPAEGTIHVTLTLTVRNSVREEVTEEACDSFVWALNNETYTETPAKNPEYVFANGAANGCDSIVELNLTINYSLIGREVVVNCGPYTWETNSKTYNQSGVKTYKGTTPEGCVIRDTLDLTIENGRTSHEYVTACGSYTWDVNGETYSQAGTYAVTGMTEAANCPTYDTLTLTLVDQWVNREAVVSCGPYTWAANGKTYNQSGTKTYKGVAADGCTVRDTLDLTIAKGRTTHEYVTNCGPYTWEVTGVEYKKSGTKYYKSTTEQGCPIRDTLTLTVVDKWTSHEYVVSCDAPYTWEVTGKTYNKSGVKYYKDTADDGCMIYDTLTLTIGQSSSSREVVTNCGPYTWAANGKTYNQSGTKTFKGLTATGCPARDTLDLTIVTEWMRHETITNCGPYTWATNGVTYEESTEVTYDGVDEKGCPIHDTLTLTVANDRSSYETVVTCGAYTWEVNGKTYNKSGLKYYKGTTEDGCTVRDTLNLVLTDRRTSNTYVENCGPYTWDVNGKTYNKGGVKTFKSTADDGCLLYDTLTLTIVNCEDPANGENIALGESDALNAMTVYPNPTTGRLQINAAQVDKVEVLDMVGRRVAVYENTLTLDLSNLAAGTYTLRVTMPEGVALRKVVKR